jgi:DNA-binding transcriptional regulator YhcF (GntR family)
METECLNDLRSLIRAHAGRRLPSVRALAARWKCSPTTAQAVLRKARARGWIETRAGAGSWASGRVPELAAPPSRRTSETLAADLKEEIRAGRWGSGERLPPPKDLATRYGVHPATVRKAFGRLTEGSVLEQRGRAWLVARPRRHAREKPVLLCLGAKEGEGSLRLGSDREWDFWREIQIEAARNDLSPEIHPWSGKLPDLKSRPMGAVVSTWHLPDPHPLLSALHRARLPAAVWLENPVLSPARLPLQSPWLGFHDMAYGPESGTALGAHPAIRKHARIAWISPFHGAEWSRNRLEGLRRSLPREIEIHEAVGPWVSEWDFQEKAWHDPEIWKRVRLEGLVHPAGIADLVRPLMEAIGRDRLFESFSPILKTALASGSTLWVAASDWVALGCLDWLGAHGIRVPENIALAGFDDSREALRRGLTSVRFDAQVMARAMVRQLLYAETGRPRAIHYEGTVLARGSTP